MAKLVIFMTGEHCTGKTTSTNALEKYFDNERIENVKISKRKGRFDPEVIKTEMVRWLVDPEFNGVITVDGMLMDVYDRADMIEVIKNYSHSGSIPPIIAIEHKRSFKFISEHNNDKGHRPHDEKTLKWSNAHYQQPIAKENLDGIISVRGNNYLNIEFFLEYINKKFGLTLTNEHLVHGIAQTVGEAPEEPCDGCCAECADSTECDTEAPAEVATDDN